jgi:hypothetical protein
VLSSLWKSMSRWHLTEVGFWFIVLIGSLLLFRGIKRQYGRPCRYTNIGGDFQSYHHDADNISHTDVKMVRVLFWKVSKERQQLLRWWFLQGHSSDKSPLKSSWSLFFETYGIAKIRGLGGLRFIHKGCLWCQDDFTVSQWLSMWKWRLHYVAADLSFLQGASDYNEESKVSIRGLAATQS